MSKKHFIALADALRQASQQANLRAGKTGKDMQAGVEFAKLFVADACKQSNPRFNRARWFAYIAGECGPNGGKAKNQTAVR